jgi:hypothetical protein
LENALRLLDAFGVVEEEKEEETFEDEIETVFVTIFNIC